jgi:hypothetical protein
MAPRQKIIRRPITDNELKVLRDVISVAKWTPTTSANYKDCPHSYIIKFKTGPEWDYFANLIKVCGEMRTWIAPWGQKCRYRYLIIDGMAYWVDWPALNRAAASTLEPLPGPSVPVPADRKV